MARKKGLASAKEQFIVTWDNSDGDPVMVLDTLAKAQEFVTGLMTNDDAMAEKACGSYVDTDYVEKETVKMYKGILIGKPKITVTFDLKA